MFEPCKVRISAASLTAVGLSIITFESDGGVDVVVGGLAVIGGAVCVGCCVCGGGDASICDDGGGSDDLSVLIHSENRGLAGSVTSAKNVAVIAIMSVNVLTIHERTSTI